MSYPHYTRERERERTPRADADSYYSRPLVRRNSKRQRVDLYSDNDDDDNDDGEYDDYPYTSTHPPVAIPSKPSRALTIRRPSQLEKYNIWSYSPSPNDRDHTAQQDRSDDPHETHRYKYPTRTPCRMLPSDTNSEDERREREFRLKVKASFGRPKALSRSNSYSAHTHAHEREREHERAAPKAMAWSGELFKRRERWEDVAWESRERVRACGNRGFWDEEPRAGEKGVRFQRVKRTRTDTWKPLVGFRRG